MKATRVRGDDGFTLFEVAVALAVLATIATAGIPYFIRHAETTAARKTAQEISIIQDAARWYYLRIRSWPVSVQALKTSGFLSQSFPIINAWSRSYSLSPGSRSLAISTVVPDSVRGLLTRALPTASVSVSGASSTVTSVIPPPGQEASVSVVRNVANDALRMARESALPPRGPVIYVGQGRCPRGYVVIQTYQRGIEPAYCQKIAR